MSFAQPEWLLLGLLVVAGLALGLRAAERRRRRDLARLAAPALLGELLRSVSTRRRRVRRGLVLLGVAAAFMALARPELGFTWTESKRRGIDVLIAVDVSRSMLARDVSPNRLTRAKLAVEDLLERLDGDRVGLIAFAGSAFLQCPLTLDEEAFRRALEALEPGVLPRGGSDLASAIRLAIRAFETEKTNFKLLVLLSDGEDLAGDALAAAAEAAEQQVRLYTVGVGTPAGELIPAGDEPGRFVEQDGRIVKSRLDESTLREIAERTGGFYAPLGQRGEGVAAVYDGALAPIPEEELASRMRRVPIERFQWPLAFAIVLLIAETLVGDRVQRTAARDAVRPLVPRASKRTPLVLALALLPGLAAPARAWSSPAEGERLYDEGRFAEALAAYRAAIEADPSDPRLQLNLGAAAYRAGELATAAEAFAAALAAEEPALKERSFYNLGNTQYRLGEASRSTNPESTRAAWEQAIAAYEEALRLDEADQDARFNRDFVKKKLEELAQPPPQPSPRPSPQPSPQPSSEPSPGEPGGDGQQGGQDGSPPPSPSPGGATPPPPASPTPSAGGQGSASTPSPRPSAGGAPSPAGGGEEKEPEPKTAPEEPRPGQMSPREAADLLDSLAGDEPTLPAMMEPGEPPSPEQEERDW